MKTKMHRIELGRAAVILLGGALLFFAVSAAAESGSVQASLSEEVGSKDLGALGEKVIPSLDLSEAELRVVLRSIAKFSGLNIITSDEVQGIVSLYLENVTVKSALDAILTTNGYGYIYKDKVVYVLSASQLGEDRVRTITEVYFLQYLDAAEVEESLQDVFDQGSGSGGGGGSGGGSGSISSNASSNSIIVTDTPDQVEKIVALLAQIDRPFKQVRIESRLVEVKYDTELQLGIDWLYFDEGSSQNRADVNLSPLDRATGLTDAAGMFQFGLVRDGGKTLSGFIQADEQTSNVRILANPSVTVLHNTKAEIKITNDIPYVEANVSQGVITESVSFRETGITLEVTPRINDGGDIMMKVKPTQRIAGPRVILQNSNAFPVDTRSVETELRVRDADTFVIGGLRSSEMDHTRQKVPILGDIPVFGNLFKRKLDNVVQTELLLFVTPAIIRDDYKLTPKQAETYNKFEEMNQELHLQIQKEEENKKRAEEYRQRQEAKRAARKKAQNERKKTKEEQSSQAQQPQRKSSDEPRVQSGPAFDWEGQWSTAAAEPAEGIQVQGDAVVSAQAAVPGVQE